MNDKKFIIGIDIGGTKCAVVLADCQMNIYHRIAFPTEVEKGPNHTIDRILFAIEQLLSKNGLAKNQIESIGISCGGPLDSKSGVILSPPNLPGWDNIPIKKIIEEQMGAPVYLENDANAGALAEWTLGAGRGCKNMIFITFGTGLGAGLILNGRLYSGANDMAGEIGHIRLAEDGPEGYGKAGSFEGFCSGGGIAKLARREIEKRLKRGEVVGFCPTLDMVKSITAKDVGLAAERGDPAAVDILKISARYLGLGLSILIDILNPEKIILGSIFVRIRKFLQPVAEEVIRKEALEISAKKCLILPAQLGERIGDYASLCVALRIGKKEDGNG
ncbi:ROK family protein [Thermosediminibacter litoriperuensis]|uniref:Glucokinase n=1 Tax=Thermosediminibacter litoriperuensis TaxID=291989 RepID=A0A5S5AG30_9FIRM|nr:ROK family protein [Thermosediminibacter litoriperuensis]TYP48725.1 glucokinase [Thermosediminibacter litoriperuensis]